MIFGLTPLGVFHTLVSLVALYTGVWALIRYKQFSVYDRLSQVYFIFTLVTAASGLGIFQHGGFGPPHALSILTILALVAGVLTERALLLGAYWSRYFVALCYSTTLFFHAIPGFNESLSRLPPGKPLTTGPDDPVFKAIAGVLFALYLIGMAAQLLWLRKQPALKPAPAVAR
jgi:uncharacterized membrane protein